MDTKPNGPDMVIIKEVEEIVVIENEDGNVEKIAIIDEMIVEQPDHHHHHHEGLQIFVNRIPKTAKDGVKHEMTGCEVAGLVPVSCDKAVVKRGHGAEAQGISLTENIKICNAEHFLVTRDNVEGGYG